MLDHAGESRGPGAEQARAEAEALRERLRARLWDTDISKIEGVRVHWHLGFVRELEIDVKKLPSLASSGGGGRRRRYTAPASEAALERLMPLALRQFALRWVEVVRVHVDNAAAPSYSRWINGDVHSPTLREIHIGEPPRMTVRPSGPWEVSGSGSMRGSDRLILHFPRLRSVTVGGELMRLPCCAGSSQARVLVVQRLPTQPLTSQNRAALARALWDESHLVHNQAFAAAQALGGAAEFLLPELAWFLRPPLSKRDPRPTHALKCLAAIGGASASVLGEVLINAPPLVEVPERREALMLWLAALGPAGKAAKPLIDAALKGNPKDVPKSVRDAAKRARKALDGVPFLLPKPKPIDD